MPQIFLIIAKREVNGNKLLLFFKKKKKASHLLLNTFSKKNEREYLMKVNFWHLKQQELSISRRVSISAAYGNCRKLERTWAVRHEWGSARCPRENFGSLA